MRKGCSRYMALLFAACLLFTSVVVTANASNPGGAEFTNTYRNTGNQRADIIGVALTQMGYRELPTNDTKYGDWYGLPEQEWCAMFVSWCARQAEVSTDIIRKNSWVHPNSFGVATRSGADYVPQPGDLFFSKGYGHVGLVWYVEGEFFYSIEGNAKYHDYTVPDDPEEDSYYVMSNKRLIADYTFGVPAYEGCDGEHTYVRGVEDAHPHRVYYTCTDCEDQYYTGYTDCLLDCSACFSCGCSPDAAGYYTVLPQVNYLRLRRNHNWNSTMSTYVTMGSVVYVYGISRDGWACIDTGGERGHILSSYLQKYPDAPNCPTAAATESDYFLGDEVTLTFDQPENTEYYRLQLLCDGVPHLEQTVGMVESYTLTDLPAGSYRALLRAGNRAGVSEATAVEFVIRNDYTVSFDLAGGEAGPEQQNQTIGSLVTLSEVAPVREGYTFLGWADGDPKIAAYMPGDEFGASRDVTLTAVWKEDAAVAESLTIRTAAEHTVYLLGDNVDVTGLSLELTYSDGTVQWLKSGFEITGFDSQTVGTKNVTLSCAGLSVSYEVQVLSYIPGDISGNRTVNRDDVIQLLLHVSMPEEFSISVPADFTGDGKVNREDVIQLLLHVSMPGAFPLEIPSVE